ncbi:MAG TPA: HAMP domain-containing sensor histidine kinase [Gaiellaceae bacterium]
MLQRLSLRTRLVLGVVVLAALGLVVADVATYSSLRSFLIQRVDSTLNSTHAGVESVMFARQGNHGANDNDDIGALLGSIPGYCIQVRTLQQTSVRAVCIPQFGETTAPPTPSFPTVVTLPARPNSGDGDRVRFYTVSAADSNDRYRVRASIEGTNPNNILLIAAPLHGVDDTLHRLLLIELLVTAVALGGLTALALWVVRIGLRPLREIEATADAIAAGDLSRRVEHAEPRTEVGRLGLALNVMMGQIEGAFNARTASEARLRRFVSDASHELRTPLAAVRAYAELFTRGAAARPDDLARSMQGIERESERMGVLVDDLLLLARLDEGRPLARERVRVDELAREAVETARAVDPTRRIDLETEPLTIVGDHDRLRQALDNLLANVRAHTPAGTAARVTVRREGATAVIDVSDDGPGMAADDRERVFERFFRADSSRSRTSGGTGLGLAIVAAVVEAHSGEVCVVGNSTFRLALPLQT